MTQRITTTIEALLFIAAMIGIAILCYGVFGVAEMARQFEEGRE